MEANWEKRIRKVTPYTPGEQPKQSGVIKLNTNENPYPPAPEVQKILDETDPVNLRKYPDPTADELITALSEAYDMPKDQIFVGVGSDDVLAMSFLAFFASDDPVLFPDITYSFYDVWADEFRIPFETVPLKDDFSIDPLDYISEDACDPNGNLFNGRRKGSIGGIVIPNPNAPTGLDAGTENLEKIIAGNPDCVVIIDEAYVDFGATSILPLVKRYDNLLVTQTFSKSRALAGSRIGFAFGSKRLIKYLYDVKYSFNSYTMDQITIKIGAASLRDPEYFRMRTSQIIKTRENAKKELSALGFTFPDSQTNFIFASHKSVKAKELFEALKANNIYVRYFDKPRIDNYLRITIGTDQEMQKLFDFLKFYLPKD